MPSPRPPRLGEGEIALYSFESISGGGYAKTTFDYETAMRFAREHRAIATYTIYKAVRSGMFCNFTRSQETA